MRTIFLALLFASLPAQAAESYWFEPLTENAVKHVAPAKVQEFMATALRKDLEECRDERRLQEAQIAKYFSAIALDLNADGMTDYLVFPSALCFTFFGMHSVAYWVTVGQSGGGFKILLSGRQDGIEILKTKSRGLPDIKSFYGQEVQLYRYDGKAYRLTREYLRSNP